MVTGSSLPQERIKDSVSRIRKPWIVDSGQWTVESGQWIVEALDSGQWTVHSQEGRLEILEWTL